MKRPHPVDQVVAILDLTGLSMSNISSTVLGYVRAVSGIDQANYPGACEHLRAVRGGGINSRLLALLSTIAAEQMYKTFVINAPSIFAIAWKVIRGFLDPRTVSKVGAQVVLHAASPWPPTQPEKPCCPWRSLFVLTLVWAPCTRRFPFCLARAPKSCLKFLIDHNCRSSTC